MKNIAKKLQAEKEGDQEDAQSGSEHELEPEPPAGQRPSMSPSPVPQSTLPLPEVGCAPPASQPQSAPIASTSTSNLPASDVYPNTRIEPAPVAPLPIYPIPPFPNAPMRTFSTGSSSSTGSFLTVPDAHLLSLRRPSLPTYHIHNAPKYHQPPHPHSAQASLFAIPPYPSSTHPNPLPFVQPTPIYANHNPRPQRLPDASNARRLTADPHTLQHAHRLSSHPYAHVIAQRNAELHPPLQRHHSLAGPEARPEALGARGLALRMYAPARDVGPLLPGPLPAPDFSFGAPLPCEPAPQAPAMARSTSHPQLHQVHQAQVPYASGAAGQPIDSKRFWDEGYGTSDTYPNANPFAYRPPSFRPSARPGPRFGSLASVGDSDESADLLFSDGSGGGRPWSGSASGDAAGVEEGSSSRRGSMGSFGASASGVSREGDGRRGSVASTHFVQRFSDLDVNNPNSNPSSQASSRRPSYAHLPHIPPSSTGSYSSSTLPGDGGSAPRPISRRQSSSLAYALRPSTSNNSNRRNSRGEYYPNTDLDTVIRMLDEYKPANGAQFYPSSDPFDLPLSTEGPIPPSSSHHPYMSVEALPVDTQDLGFEPVSLYPFISEMGRVGVRHGTVSTSREGVAYGGQPPSSRTGAIELQRMCVPADPTLEALQSVGTANAHTLQYP
ncbi:hypothetical protein BKA93DRAFT_871231 [Sparassis latifolia]